MTITLDKPDSSPDTQTVGSVNLLTDVITKDRTLPDGYDGWAIRTVRPDFRSSNDYRYPHPGQVAKAPGPISTANRGECPLSVGDGICAAGTWEGMASGGVPARTLLLVAYRQSDVLGGSIAGKVRLREFLVVDVIDGDRLLVESGRSADLRYANLRSADLRYADLRYANLRSADLGSADLGYADLRSADLRYANLRSADLGSADLGYADLRSANLGYANLRSADLRLRGVAALAGAYWDRDRWTVRSDGLIVPKDGA